MSEEKFNAMGEEMMTEEQKDKSSRRSVEFHFDDLGDLTTADLKIESTDDGNIIVVRGQARGHEVVMRCFDFNSSDPIYSANVDGYEELTGRPARKLFEKYYPLAKLQNL